MTVGLKAGMAALLAVTAILSFSQAASAQDVMAVSQCQAIAERLPNVRYASLDAVVPVQSAAEDVRITFVAHATYLIETPGGVSIATDYFGASGPVEVPTVVTMNKAHSTHNTANPDPAIEHVLPGWNPEGGPADHDLVVGDAYIRNVTTDIRSRYGAMEADGNSIFVFEVAGLCIGHLGHLHHLPTNQHYAEIGRLDVVMVPVDGGLTLGAERIGEVVRRLRSSLILPMHRIGPPISSFLDLFDESYAREISTERSVTVSLRSLPSRPTIHVLQGL